MKRNTVLKICAYCTGRVFKSSKYYVLYWHLKYYTGDIESDESCWYSTYFTNSGLSDVIQY